MIATAHEVSVLESRWDWTDDLFRVDAFLGFGEHCCRDVGSQYSEAEAGMRLRVFAQHNGQRIRLLSGRASGTPDCELLPASVSFHQPGKSFLDQKIKVRRFAKEVSLVGCYYINQVNHLVLQSLMAKEVIAVLGIGCEIEGSQAPLDADLKHGSFFRAKVDARFAVDQVAKPRIVSG